jgi:hypothetical protein
MSEAFTETSMDRACILVLGMHRSGTSALSGCLSQLGCKLPVTLAPADHNNQSGYFESRAFWSVNDDLLAEVGSGWDDWVAVDLTALPKSTYAQFLKRATECLHVEYPQGGQPFLIKDPRICRLAPLWLEALRAADCQVHVVHTHRNPQDVAASLARRDGFEPAFGLLLWLRHVLEAESATRGLPRVFTSYRHLMEDWQRETDKLDDALDLGRSSRKPSLSKAVDAFLSTKLQHFNDPITQTLNDPALPQNIRDTFLIMERWAKTGEQTEDHATLDTIRSDLDALSVAFAPLVRPGQMAMLALAESRKELDTHISALEVMTQREASNRADLADREAEIVKLQDNIHERELSLQTQARTLDRIRTELALREAEIVKLQESIRHHEQAAQALARSLDQQRADNAQLHSHVVRAESENHALLQSTSWRLTAPLRRVSRLLR